MTTSPRANRHGQKIYEPQKASVMAEYSLEATLEKSTSPRNERSLGRGEGQQSGPGLKHVSSSLTRDQLTSTVDHTTPHAVLTRPESDIQLVYTPALFGDASAETSLPAISAAPRDQSARLGAPKSSLLQYGNKAK